MNKVRTIGIFANLLLELEDAKHLTSKDSNAIIRVLSDKWKEAD